MDDIRAIHGHLAQEYLTWLLGWTRQEAGDEPALVLDGERLDLLWGGQVLLGPVVGGSEARQVAIRDPGDDSRGGGEMGAALRGGLLVNRLRLGLVVGDDEYLLTLDADTLRPSGLRLPAGAPDRAPESREAVILERIYLVRRLLDALDALLGAYLTARLAAGGGWPAEVLHLVEG